MWPLFLKLQKFVFLNFVVCGIMFFLANSTNCKAHTLFLEAKAPSGHQEIPYILGNVKVHYIVYKNPPLVPYIWPPVFNSHHPILFLKYILVLSSYLCLDIQSSLFFQLCSPKPDLHFSSVPSMPHIYTLPIASSLMSPWLLIQSLYLTVQCPPTSCYFCPVKFEYFLW